MHITTILVIFDKMKSHYEKSDKKIEVPTKWTSYLLATHPIQFITTIGRVNEKLKTNIAPFATCLDTSYNPQYITISAAVHQHTANGQTPNKGRMNTFSNIKQNGLFIVNTPGIELLDILDIVSIPYERNNLEDKIEKANLTKTKPLVLPRDHKIYPPLIEECLVHLECEVVDIHRPRGSDHYNITGKVVGASYDNDLGSDLDEIRQNIVRKTFHHFGPSSKNPGQRYIAFSTPSKIKNTLILAMEKK